MGGTYTPYGGDMKEWGNIHTILLYLHFEWQDIRTNGGDMKESKDIQTIEWRYQNGRYKAK